MKREIDVGNSVICDICNADYTESKETGGIEFGSRAACPKCAPKLEADAVKYNETQYIRSRCPEAMAYADWVRDVLRGGMPAKIEIQTFDSFDDMLKAMNKGQSETD